MKKHAFQEYFYYTRRERSATIGMILLLLIFALLPEFYHLLLPEKEPDLPDDAFMALQRISDSTAPFKAIQPPRGPGKETGKEPMLFEFDPNNVTGEVLNELGISSRVAKTWLNYLRKGGRFYEKSDLKKIYGLNQLEYERLAPWVAVQEISSKKKVTGVPNAGNPNNVFSTDSVAGVKPETESLRIDVNRATADDWQRLRGIGPGYSRRIVNFRDKLGGFVSLDQVAETYGLPDSVFRAIRPFLELSPLFGHIHINSDGLEELKAHPYLSNFQATVLNNYRTQHGKFRNLEDLRKIKAGFEEADWVRLAPYIQFE